MPGTFGLAVFDANVLFSATLLYMAVVLAQYGMVRIKVSEDIRFETTTMLARRGRPAARKQFEVRISDLADIEVGNYRRWIEHVRMPPGGDREDRHVVACAIQSGSPVIVSNDKRGFPKATLDPWGIRCLSFDHFLSACLELRPELVIDVVESHRYGAQLYLEALRKAKAVRSAEAIDRLLY